MIRYFKLEINENKIERKTKETTPECIEGLGYNVHCNPRQYRRGKVMYTVICPLGNQGWAMRNLPAPIQEN